MIGGWNFPWNLGFVHECWDSCVCRDFSPHVERFGFVPALWGELKSLCFQSLYPQKLLLVTFSGNFPNCRKDQWEREWGWDSQSLKLWIPAPCGSTCKSGVWDLISFSLPRWKRWNCFHVRKEFCLQVFHEMCPRMSKWSTGNLPWGPAALTISVVQIPEILDVSRRKRECSTSYRKTGSDPKPSRNFPVVCPVPGG